MGVAKQFIGGLQWRFAAEARSVLSDLKKHRVFFFPNAGLNWNPLFRFTDRCDLFVYADHRFAPEDFRQAPVLGATPVGEALKRVKRVPFNDRNWQEFAAETPSPWAELLRPTRTRQRRPKPWIEVVKHERTVGDEKRPVWLVYVGNDEVHTLRCLLQAQIAPKYLCLTTSGQGERDAQRLDWLSAYGKAIQDNPGCEPEFVVRGWGAFDWPWIERWQNHNGWPEARTCALPLREHARITPDSQKGNRTVVVRQAALTPATCADADLIVMTPDAHRSYEWPAGVKLLVDAAPSYKPDSRTVRLNPHYTARRLCWKPLKEFLATVDAVCRKTGAKRVASVRFGFEDEGAELRAWRQRSGPASTLTMYCESPGDVESFGPYVDAIE